MVIKAYGVKNGQLTFFGDGNAEEVFDLLPPQGYDYYLITRGKFCDAFRDRNEYFDILESLKGFDCTTCHSYWEGDHTCTCSSYGMHPDDIEHCYDKMLSTTTAVGFDAADEELLKCNKIANGERDRLEKENRESDNYFLYKYYQGGELLYIGLTSQHPYRRYKEHCSKKDINHEIFDLVDRIEVARVRTRHDMKIWETFLIEAYDPPLNNSGRSSYYAESLRKCIMHVDMFSEAPKFFPFTPSELKECGDFEIDTVPLSSEEQSMANLFQKLQNRRAREGYVRLHR